MYDYFKALNKLCEAESLTEVRKEDDKYLIGPFWIIGESLAAINLGNLEIIAEQFLINWDGEQEQRVPRSEFTHKGIWESKYKSKYKVAYNYYPRGRVSFNSNTKKFYINIPKGLNEELVLPIILNRYGIKADKVKVKYTDPTSGDHYSFDLK